MNIANGPAAAISLQSLSKKTNGKGKTEAYTGKVISKSGKEIQVLINDKVYKIEPGNAQKIKIGDKIQVFFGKNLPPEISQEMLKKISGKLIDVFSLSLPYKSTQELEDLINQMPQNERLRFAKISNELANMVKTILKEDFSLPVENMKTDKDSVDILDPKLPFNRRLIELSLKAKEMGKAWDQIPDTIKKEIIKEYVLFDLNKGEKKQMQETSQLLKNQMTNFSKDDSHSQELAQKTNEQPQEKPDLKQFIAKKNNTPEREIQSKEQIVRQQKHNNTDSVQKDKNPINQQQREQPYNLSDKGPQSAKKAEPTSVFFNKTTEAKEIAIDNYENKKTNNVQQQREQPYNLSDKGHQSSKKAEHSDVFSNKASKLEETPLIKTLEEFKKINNRDMVNEKVLKRSFFRFPVSEKEIKSVDISLRKAHTDLKTLKSWLNIFLSKGSKNIEPNQPTALKHIPAERIKSQPENKTVENSQKTIKKEMPISETQIGLQDKTQRTAHQEETIDPQKLKVTNNQNQNTLNIVIETSKKNEYIQNETINESLKGIRNDHPNKPFVFNPTQKEKTDNSLQIPHTKMSQNSIENNRNSNIQIKENLLKEVIKQIQTMLEKSLSKPVSLEKNLENLERVYKEHAMDKHELSPIVDSLRQSDLLKDPDNILSLIQKITSSLESFENPFITNQENHSMSSPDISEEFTFNKIRKIPLMDIEIKNLASQFKSLGIEPTEGVKTIYDIVNIVFRSVKEESVDTHLFPVALKNYLKLKLPQLIINNDINQKNEENLISKIEHFSKKAFIFIKGYADKLKANKYLESVQLSEKSLESKTMTDKQNTPLKQQNKPDNQLLGKDFEATGKQQKTPASMGNKSPLTDNPINKEEALSSQSKPKGETEHSLPTEKRAQVDPKLTELSQKSEVNSAKFLKFLNISSEKTDFTNAYSSLISLNKQPFSIDFQHQKMDKGGYEKSEMYRVFIETNTQLFGTVFVDTIVAQKNIDIYIYAEDQYAREFTNNSSTLIKRIKETDYNLRGLFIREKMDQNGILKLKVKQYANPKKEGGFFRFA